MSKVNKLKVMLKKMLEAFANVSTDKGLLSYASEGKLPEIGEAVYKVDEEGNETPAEDGEYRTEEGDVIIVADGKVEEIREGERVEETVEEVVEEMEDAEPVAEIVEPAEPEPVNEDVVVEPEENPFEARIAALEERMVAYEARMAAMEERLALLEKEPVVDSAEESFRKVNNLKKTGDKKMDNLNRILSAR